MTMIALNQTDKPPKWCPGLTRDMDLTRGLLRYYPVWEGSGGIVADLRGAHGVAADSPTWAAGESRYGGPILSFDGEKHFLTLPNLALPAKSASAFVVFRSNDVTATQVLFSQGDIAGANFLIQINSSGIRGVFAQDGTGAKATIAALAPIANDTWYHVAFVFDGTKGWLYLNGILKTFEFAASTSLGTGRYITRFGIRPDTSTQQFNGDLVEFGVYGRALSADDVAQSYCNSFELCRMGRRVFVPPAAAATILPHMMQFSC